jgi:hypothetical protein
MIAALSANDAGARTLADRALIGDGDLERRIHRFGTRAGKEDMTKLGCIAARRDLC